MKNIFYGIKNGKIISINDVESGIKCECVCPSCGERLIAKKGQIMVHHFAHVSQKECEYGYETSLHLLAKDIIKNSNYFVLPKEKLDLEYYNPSKYNGKKYAGLNDPLKIKIDKVDVELQFDNVKPDLVIYSDNKKYFVEIYVTHKIDEEKRKRIIEKNVDTIEIDLSNIGKETEYDILKEILLNDDDRKYWSYNAKIENIINKIDKECRIHTVMHGFAHHTEYCPINSRMWRGTSYANVTDDCVGCEYCLGITPQKSIDDDSDVLCIAAENYIKPKTNNSSLICPECKGKLILKDGKFGKFYGCSNFPKCRYTRNY